MGNFNSILAPSRGVADEGLILVMICLIEGLGRCVACVPRCSGLLGL
jgi:hypothetical protein